MLIGTDLKPQELRRSAQPMILKFTVLTFVLSLRCLDVSAQATLDSTLENQLRKMYSDDDGEVRYFPKLFDLNGDRTPEVMVHVVGPDVCGTGGCETHIFAKRGKSYRLISTINLTHPLVVAALDRSHGWRNLIVFVAGGGIIPGYYAELRFNGKTYPDNPTLKPARRISGKPRGTVLIKDFRLYTEGKPLIPR
ncbi:MAG TPA: hypothetical protein VGD41_13325 [Pyrinomonadaceae bacterium]